MSRISEFTNPVRRIIDFTLQKFTKMTSTVDERSAVPRAIKWVKTNTIPGGGIVPHPKIRVGYQEVTGYFIPTLYSCGEKDLARELVKWETSVQRPDGAFCAIDNVPYTFDTAQVVRGFLAALDDLPEIENNLRRACDYVDRHIAASGEIITESCDQLKCSDGSIQSVYSNLYILPQMVAAGRKLSEPRYIAAAERALNYFREKPDLVDFKPELGTLSHFFGYILDALIDLGEIELAQKGIQQVTAIQKQNGAIPAYPGVDWICSTGMAQLAIAWYKLGNREPADNALVYLQRIQNRSGGFYGSYGFGGKYFPNEEISWAVKFFLDACLLSQKRDRV
jgi:malonyl-CoA O-methyltransferase